MLVTQRLCLRPWQPGDAEALFAYASSPEIGPAAGWPPHQSVEESREIIRRVLCGSQCYAVCLKDSDEPIGSIELKDSAHSDWAESSLEAELGYWIGRPYWGQGLMSEAVRALLAHGFDTLGLARIWCGYYAGNERSRRVQEKLGFRYVGEVPDVFLPLLNERRTLILSCLDREEWKA